MTGRRGPSDHALSTKGGVREPVRSGLHIQRNVPAREKELQAAEKEKRKERKCEKESDLSQGEGELALASSKPSRPMPLPGGSECPMKTETGNSWRAREKRNEVPLDHSRDRDRSEGSSSIQKRSRWSLRRKRQSKGGSQLRDKGKTA